MRLHFAAELILELVTRKLDIEKIGAHITETKSRIDFFYYKNISLVFENLLDEYNEIIASDKPIKTGFTDFLESLVVGHCKIYCGSRVRYSKKG